MKLIQCTIRGFGKLRDRVFTFEDGLNVFCHDNGFGKTTLSMFLKAMLYGLSDSRKRDLTENERTRFLPWDGLTAGGALIYEIDGKQYRVERTFSKKSTGADDTCTVYDLQTGAECTPEIPLGEMLFGVDADGFERTVFLSERNLSGKNENKSIAAKLADLVGTDGDIGALDGVLRAMDDKRKEYFKRTGGGELGRLDAELRSLTVELRSAEQELSQYAANDGLTRERTEEEARLREEYRALQDTWRALPSEEAARYLDGRLTDAKAQLSRAEREYDDARSRFGDTVPSYDDIHTAQEASVRRAADMHSRAEEQAASDALHAFFTRPTDEEELSCVRAALHGKRPSYLPALITAILGTALCALCVVHLATLPFGAAAIVASLSLLLHAKKEKTRIASAMKFIASYPTSSKDPLMAFDEICRNYANISLQNKQKSADFAVEFKGKPTDALNEDILRTFSSRTGLSVDLDALSAALSHRTALDLAEEKLSHARRAYDDAAAQRASFEQGYDPSKRARTERLLHEKQQAIEDCIKAREQQEGRLRMMEECAQRIERLTARIAYVKERRDVCNKEYTTLVRTMEYLKRAAEQLSARYKEKTVRGFDRYLRRLTGKSSEDYQLTTAFEVRRDEMSEYKSIDAYSRGTRDIHALALRLALIDALFEREAPFLLLDDPFSSLDDGRLAEALSTLRELARDRQILYFTCTTTRIPGKTHA